jgi:hypothetical protein
MPYQRRYIVLLFVILFFAAFMLTRHPEQPAKLDTDSHVDLSRFTSIEVLRQSKAAIASLLQCQQPQEVSLQASRLRELAHAPILGESHLKDRLALIDALEKAAISRLEQLQIQVQERDALLARIRQGDMAFEMLVAPQISTDDYLAALYLQYKGYSDSVTVLLKSLYTNTDVRDLNAIEIRLQGMTSLIQENYRLLCIEIVALRENEQSRSGMEALQQMVKPEQGTVASWIRLQAENQKLLMLAETLRTQMVGL